MRVVPLPSVSTSEFEKLFDQEVENWKKALFWDHRPTINLLRRQIRSRSLPGHALVTAQGILAGYSYYVVDHPIGYIGNLYVAPGWSTPENYGQLLAETLFSLRSWGSVRRIECQLVSFNCNFTPLFRQEGFSILKRYFLSLSVGELSGHSAGNGGPAGFSVQPWDERLFDAAAQVVYDSFRGSPDEKLCHDYQTPTGCSRFLHNLVRGPGCGSFTPETSYFVLDKRGHVCAAIITSRIGRGTGMIPQISVRRRDQRKGLGSWLLRTYFQVAQEGDLHRITLSVSQSNRAAHRLYSRLGFRPAKEFHAFLWET